MKIAFSEEQTERVMRRAKESQTHFTIGSYSSRSWHGKEAENAEIHSGELSTINSLQSDPNDCRRPLPLSARVH